MENFQKNQEISAPGELPCESLEMPADFIFKKKKKKETVWIQIRTGHILEELSR